MRKRGIGKLLTAVMALLLALTPFGGMAFAENGSAIAYGSGIAAAGYGFNGKLIAEFEIVDSLPDFSEYIAVSGRGELEKIGNDPSFPLNGKYYLTADIDLSETEWIPVGANSVNSDINPFTGTFDGQGYVISSLAVTGAYEYAGLFAYTDGAAIINLGLEGANVSIVYNYTDADVYAGGICGYNDGSVSNCYNTGDVSAAASSDSFVFSGGICGYSGVSVSNCYNTGQVSAAASSDSFAFIGGICGHNDGGVTNCFNKGYVSGSCDNYADSGGICGVNYGSVSSSYNTGAVSTFTSDNYADAGGICGFNLSSGVIGNCYNRGNVSASAIASSAFAAGISAINSGGSVNNCYNTGAASVADPSGYTGGICALNPGGGAINNCYCLNLYNSTWGAQLTSTQMKNPANYTGFDSDTVWENDPAINDGYPYLTAIPPEEEDIGPSENTTIHFSTSSYVFEFGEDIGMGENVNFLTGDFHSTDIVASDDTITWECSSPGVITFGNLSVLYGDGIYSNSAVFWKTINIHSVGEYTITATTKDGATAQTSIKIVYDLDNPDGGLLISLVTDYGALKYINGKLYNSSGKKVDSIKVTAHIRNLSGYDINNIDVAFMANPDFNFNNGQDNYKIELIQLQSGAEDKIELDLYLQQSAKSWNGMTQNIFLVDLTVQKDDGFYFYAKEDIIVSYAIEYNKDSFSFINSTDSFLKGKEWKYEISNDAKKYLNWYDYINIWSVSDARWGGSCHGMSSMISTFDSGGISPSVFGKNTVYSLNKPAENIPLRDAINILQSSQYILGYFDAIAYAFTQEELREDLVNAVKDIENGGCIPNIHIKKSLLSGHSIVAYNVIEKDGYYEIYVCDPNSLYPTKMRIKTDYSSCEYSYDYDEGAVVAWYDLKLVRVITDKSVMNINTLVPGYLSSLGTSSALSAEIKDEYDFISIIADTLNEIEIENSNHETALFLDSEMLGGNLPVLNYYSIPSGEMNLTKILIPNTAENQTLILKNKTAGKLNIQVNNNHIIGTAMLSNGLHEIVYNSKGSILFSSDENCDNVIQLVYTDSIGNTGVYATTLDGKSTKNGYINAVEDGVVVYSDNPISANYIFECYNDDEFYTEYVTPEIESGQEVLFADVNNSITGFIDANGDGNFDENIELNIQFLISVYAGEGGAVEGGGLFGDGAQVELTAVPDDGFAFDGWYEWSAEYKEYTKIAGAGAIYSFTATSNRTLEARFIPSSGYKPGDVNSDGQIDMQDVLTIYQHFRGKITLTGDALAAADVNGEGGVNMQDVLLVYQYFRGKITSVN